ncbi:MAG: BMP family ABC transporter substrate-binding protein, partial [Lactococcus sp.]|nr:BMP family ABC transporter substrate-binding protein [Lactococcus sp.]
AYGIKDGSVDLINDNMSDKAVKAVDDARKAIKSGDVKVPEK